MSQRTHAAARVSQSLVDGLIEYSPILGVLWIRTWNIYTMTVGKALGFLRQRISHHIVF